VPAIDEAWHSVKQPDGQPAYSVSKVARLPANMTPRFLALMQEIKERGDCWVSRFCFCPDAFVVNQLVPLERARRASNRVSRDSGQANLALCRRDANRFAWSDRTTASQQPSNPRIRSASLRGGLNGIVMIQMIRTVFTKQVDHFRFSRSDRPTVFIDATEWGEVLASSGKDYLQGS
jgi:hypothetical protein